MIGAGNETTGTETAIHGAEVADHAVHQDTPAQTQDDLVCGINICSCPHGTTAITDRRDYGRDRDSRDSRRRDDRDRDRRESSRRDGEKKERDRHDKDRKDGERVRDGERDPPREGEWNVRTDSEPRETGKPTQSQGLSSDESDVNAVPIPL